MRACRHLLFICLTLHPCGSRPSAEAAGTTRTPDHRQRLEAPPPPPPPCNLTNNHEVNTTEERRTRYLHAFLSSSLDGSLTEGDAILTALLVGVVRAELSQCVLGIVWDATFAGSPIIDTLALLPNVKQVVGGGAVGAFLWRAKQCRGYLLLLADPEPLMHAATQTPHDAWDYAGRMVIAGLTRTNIDAFLRTKKGRKTEHILAIVQDDAGNFAVLTNLLYQKNRLGRLFSWRKPVAGQPGHSCEPSVESISHLETKSLAIRHTTPLPDLSLMELFPDKTINLQGSTLNVITILFPPVIMRRFGVNGSVVWYGYNVRLAETLADILNFTVRFIEPAPDELWGQQLPNGSWNGMVGLFERDEGDLGIANLFVSGIGGRLEHQAYTAAYGQEQTCFMVKKETTMPRWQSVLLPFLTEMWLAVLGAALLALLLLCALSWSLVTSDETLSGRSLSFISLYILGIHLKNSRPQLPVRASLRIFVIFLWVYVMIVMEAYSAKLMAFLAVERSPAGMNTLEELYRSSLPIYGQSPFYAESLAAARNVYAKRLAAVYTALPEYDSIYKYLLSGQGAYISSTNNLKYIISLFSKNGNPTLRMMKECFLTFNMALGVQSHSPLKRNIDRAVRWVAEAGFIDHWLQETLIIAKQERKAASKPSVEGPEAEARGGVSFSLDHLQGVFIVYGIGCSLALLVFIGELLRQGHARRS